LLNIARRDAPPPYETFPTTSHGYSLSAEALLAAKRPELQPLIDHHREVAPGCEDIRTECAGVIAGAWFSSKDRRGEELIAAGLLMLGGPVDLMRDKWIRVGGTKA
jgi:hypothetical protein